jgi:hypothetical protein
VACHLKINVPDGLGDFIMTLPGADSSRGSQINGFSMFDPMITQPGYDCHGISMALIEIDGLPN